MKNLLFLSFILFAGIAHGTVRTASTSPGSQYSSLEAAYNASSNGDTILFDPGNAATYIQAPLLKRLVYIGVGFNPQKMGSSRSAFNMAPICCDPSLLGTASSGSKFYGIHFVSRVVSHSGGGLVSNILFENCLFEGQVEFKGQNGTNGFGFSGFTFRNCVFNEDNDVNIQMNFQSSGTYTNFLFTNCVFDGTLFCGSGLTGFTMDHCVFLSNLAPFTGIGSAVIQNSIFMNYGAEPLAGNTYTNNLGRLFAWPSPNIGNTDPGFVTYTAGANYSSGHNYNVTHASALTGATDGTQIGVNGGASKFNESGETLIVPIVRSLLIKNATLAPSGTIQFQINASKPTDN